MATTTGQFQSIEVRVRALAAITDRTEAVKTIGLFLAELEKGTVRAATRDADGVWSAAAWVKEGILAAFKFGVLEPVGNVPVVIEDDVVVGGNSGIYEGTIVRGRAVIAAGVILTGSTPVYDVVRGQIYRRTAERALEIPFGAVVIPGSRPLKGKFAEQHQLSIASPVIVKYRDEKTDSSTALEDALR